MLAHAVHLANGGTAGQQFFVDALFFGQREAVGRQREQGRAAARDEADHHVIGREALGQRQHALGRLQACGIGHGCAASTTSMRCTDACSAGAGRGRRVTTSSR